MGFPDLEPMSPTQPLVVVVTVVFRNGRSLATTLRRMPGDRVEAYLKVSEWRGGFGKLGSVCQESPECSVCLDDLQIGALVPWRRLLFQKIGGLFLVRKAFCGESEIKS